jgi:hypothetical protein
MPATGLRLSPAKLLLPKEGGAYGVLGEVLIAGLLIAHTAGAWCLALVLLLGFFGRQPVRWYLNFRKAPRDVGYRRQSLTVAVALGIPLVVALAAAVWLAGPWLLAPLGVAGALGAYQLAADSAHRKRDLIPQLAGASAMALSVAALVLAGGGDAGIALLAAALLCVRQWLTIPYVRLRIRRARRVAAPLAPALAGHIVAVVVAVGLAAAAVVPWLAAAAVGLLVVRTVAALPTINRPVAPARVGYTEMAIGLLYAAVVAAACLA